MDDSKFLGSLAMPPFPPQPTANKQSGYQATANKTPSLQSSASSQLPNPKPTPAESDTKLAVRTGAFGAFGASAPKHDAADSACNSTSNALDRHGEPTSLAHNSHARDRDQSTTPTTTTSTTTPSPTKKSTEHTAESAASPSASAADPDEEEDGE